MRVRSILPFLLIVLFGLTTKAQNALAIPDTLKGISFILNITDTSKVFYTGYTTNTFGVNAAYLGPTLFLNKGDSVTLNVHNQLADTTTVHWHGLHVASSNDGGPHTVILPNTTWSPKFKVRDLAGTYWYHPHLHMNTNLQVQKGAAGMIIVRDSAEAQLNLPRRYGIDDFPLVVQSKAFDAGKQIMVNNAYDSVVVVNGTLGAVLAAPAQVVRLRLLNASSERVFNFGFTANKAFDQIGSDGGLLQAPVARTRLRLAPGERAEVLLDLSGMQGQTLDLLSYASEFPSGIYGAANPAAMGGGTITGYSTNGLNGADFTVLQLQVVAQTASPVTSIPSSLVAVTPFNTSQANITRTLTFAPQTMGPSQMLNGPFVINGSSFNMGVVNYTIPRDNVEIWELTNNTAIAHPFHLHDAQFYVFDINGAAPPLGEAGRKDVVLVPAQQTVRFITKFENFCDTVPYMYHCHMLKHEDEGMMGQFVVQCPAVGVTEGSAAQQRLWLYPNPAGNKLTIDLGSSGAGQVDLIDAQGRSVFSEKNTVGLLTIETASWAPGLYCARIHTAEQFINVKFIISR